MQTKDRASAQARIAASTPKTTYGKHKNKLLPLTGSQFLRSDATTTNSERRPNEETRRRADSDASSDDSPLSDAEPILRTETKRSAVVPARRTYAQSESRSIATKPREAIKVKSGMQFDNGDEGHRSHSQSSPRSRMTVNRREAQRPARPARPKGKGKPKPARMAKSRLPLNELVMVSGVRTDDVFKESRTSAGTLVNETVSSSVQPLLDAMLSDDSEATPAKRRAKKPLSAIRKRIRTPPSGYKSLERLRRSRDRARITPTGSRPKQPFGDGFEKSELAMSPAYRRIGRHPCRQREPLIAGLQALNLVSGPLPEVVFTDESSPGQLTLKERDMSCSNAEESECDGMIPVMTSFERLDQSADKRVSFYDRAERSISAQLASVSAPRREPSVSCGSTSGDDGDDSGSDDENSGDDEDEADAADTYLDQHELPCQEDIGTFHGITPEKQALLSAPVQTSKGHNSTRRSHDDMLSMSDWKDISRQSTRSPRIPSFRRQPSSGKRILNEVSELIEDDFRVEDMLLGDKIEDPPPNYSGIEHLRKDPSHFTHHAKRTVRTSSEAQYRYQTVPNQTSSVQPKSILKNSVAYISSDSNRPESTAANTRRNSFIDLEESGYFSTAKDQLDLAPYKQPIIRKKSSSRFLEKVQVPFSDERVLETSPRKPDHGDGSSMHLLRQTDEAVWKSSAARVPQNDLGLLTRSVSRDNGTLSQSVRRRSSLKFRSSHFI